MIDTHINYMQIDRYVNYGQIDIERGMIVIKIDGDTKNIISINIILSWCMDRKINKQKKYFKNIQNNGKIGDQHTNYIEE